MIPFPYQAAGAGIIQPVAPAHNYDTWNPSDKTAGIVLSAGNLQADENTSDLENVRSTQAKTTGKWYSEQIITRTSGGGFNCIVGVRRSDESISTQFNLGQSMVLRSDGSVYTGSSGASAGTGATFTMGDRIMIAENYDDGLVFIGKNGTWLNSGNPGAGTGALFSGFTVAPGWCLFFGVDNIPTSHRSVVNTGQSSFSYAVPSGYSPGRYL